MSEVDPLLAAVEALTKPVKVKVPQIARENDRKRRKHA